MKEVAAQTEDWNQTESQAIPASDRKIQQPFLPDWRGNTALKTSPSENTRRNTRQGQQYPKTLSSSQQVLLDAKGKKKGIRDMEFAHGTF